MQRAKRDIKAAASPDALKKDTQATDVPSPDRYHILCACSHSGSPLVCVVCLAVGTTVTYLSNTQVKLLALTTNFFNGQPHACWSQTGKLSDSSMQLAKAALTMSLVYSHHLCCALCQAEGDSYV